MNIAAKYFNQHTQIIREIPFNVTKQGYISIQGFIESIVIHQMRMKSDVKGLYWVQKESQDPERMETIFSSLNPRGYLVTML